MAESLRRYTDVLSLLDMVRHGRLSLMSPERWFDQNDSFGMAEYGKRKGEGSVYALCMTEGKETAHHWQLFAGHSHGLCVQFDKDEFIAHVSKADPSVLAGWVQYKNLTEIRDLSPIPTDAIPFLKRDTFSAEAEYRVVAWEWDVLSSDTYTIKMPPSLIKKVTLGPTMPEPLARTLKDIACGQDGCDDIPFAISRLINNQSWRAAIVEGLKGNPPSSS
ncbi:MAG: hypothetical protein KKA16_07855 [Alphaproteobacteria bacterium]|nr:hypothetical protein [Alphaproteobacteria bacterium]MBU2378148.1 hypothetical protein [Alphaproteobacteria bacterium]